MNQQDVETFAAVHDVSIEAARRILEGRAEVSRDWQAKVAMCAALVEAEDASEWRDACADMKRREGEWEDAGCPR